MGDLVKSHPIHLTSGCGLAKGERVLRLTFQRTPELMELMGSWLDQKLMYKVIAESEEDVDLNERRIMFTIHPQGKLLTHGRAMKRHYLSCHYSLKHELPWLPTLSRGGMRRHTNDVPVTKIARVVSWNGQILVVAYRKAAVEYVPPAPAPPPKLPSEPARIPQKEPSETIATASPAPVPPANGATSAHDLVVEARLVVELFNEQVNKLKSLGLRVKVTQNADSTVELMVAL